MTYEMLETDVASADVSIRTAQELINFANRVNAGETSLSAILLADIDLNDVTWTPIGTSTYMYTGIFDGKGHAIKNTNVSVPKQSAGLFNCSTATITNLGAENINVTNTSGNPVQSAIIVYGTTNVTVSQCYTKDCTISGNSSGSYPTNQAGGMCMFNGGTHSISNCYVEHFERKGSGNYSRFAGGIMCCTGNNTCQLINCYINNSTIRGNGESWGGAGGISATTSNGSCTVSNSAVLNTTMVTSGSMGATGRNINQTNGTNSNNYASSTNITGSDKNSNNGLTVDSSIVVNKGFWDGTGVDGTVYLSWDFSNIWYWDSVDNLPKLRVSLGINTPIKLSDSWHDGTPHVKLNDVWHAGTQAYVKVNGEWKQQS